MIIDEDGGSHMKRMVERKEVLFGRRRTQTLGPDNVQKWYVLHYST